MKLLSGLMLSDQCEVLEELAAKVPATQAIVEIGSYKGQSTCHLAAGAILGAKAHVYAVDPWDLPGNVNGRFGFAEPETKVAFLEQIKPWEEFITPIHAFSVDAARTWRGPPISLLFIDGDHSRSAVTEDFYAWKPHLAPGATVVFDDWGTKRNPGVRQSVNSMSVVNHIVRVHIRAGRLAIGIVP